MPKNIVICMDGTWNDPSEQTNVYKLFEMLDAGETEYVKPTLTTGGHALRTGSNVAAFYFEGVGAAGRKEYLLGGVTGLGLRERVLHAYIHASASYDKGDKLWIFGFSRGAWSARSLAGLIAGTGLMHKSDATGSDALAIADNLWHMHKYGDGAARGNDFWRERDDSPIKLVGVWDTVGAMGIPVFNGIRLVDEAERYLLDFADLALNKRVANGRHALAIDEHRIDFTPTLWDARIGVDGNDDGTIQQIWFTGGHADVGGGYPNACGLSNIALRWMGQQIHLIDSGFPLDMATLEAQTAPHNHMQGRHDESSKPKWKVRKITPREIPAEAKVHETVFLRLAQLAGYRPQSLQKVLCVTAKIPAWDEATNTDLWQDQDCGTLAVGESKDGLPVQASRCWNSLQLQAKKGERYQISATGEWWDAHYHAGAAGYDSSSYVLKKFERARRVENAKWFSLIGAVHASPDLESKNPEAHNLVMGYIESLTKSLGKVDEESQLVDVGAGQTLDVAQDGFLYLFANDVIAAYGNNSGTLTVTVKRVL